MWPHSKDSCNTLIPLLLSLVIGASICGTPSGNAQVKPAERTCPRLGSRTLHLFVVILFLPCYIPFVSTTVRMVSPQKMRKHSTNSSDMEAVELKKVRNSELPFSLDVSK